MKQSLYWFKNILNIAIALLSASSCSVLNKVDYSNYHQDALTPNGVKVSDNLYCDKTEVTNFSWQEYMQWIGKVYGITSKEYHATLPDTAAWIKNSTCSELRMEVYSQHPAYQNYPVVGISQEQAIAFTNWRTDRVMEFILIRNGVLERRDTTQNTGSPFSIDSYFKGTHHLAATNKPILPHSNFIYVLRYALPTKDERARIIEYADSVNQIFLEKCNSKKEIEIKTTCVDIYADIDPCTKKDGKTQISSPRNIPNKLLPKSLRAIYNVRGNVGEWAHEANTSYGGSWLNSLEEINNSDTFHPRSANIETGFRNVCRWELIAF